MAKRRSALDSWALACALALGLLTSVMAVRSCDASARLRYRAHARVMRLARSAQRVGVNGLEFRLNLLRFQHPREYRATVERMASMRWDRTDLGLLMLLSCDWQRLD